MILTFVSDDASYGRICRVNKIWYEVGELAWKQYCERRGLLKDEERTEFYISNGKDWKWICKAKLVSFVVF